MTKSANLPPDITVTRADVLAVPINHQDDEPQAGDVPAEGRSWHLVRFAPEDVCDAKWLAGRLVWVDLPAGLPFAERSTVEKVMRHDAAAALTRGGAHAAIQAFLWQTALASDAALNDIDDEAINEMDPATRLAVLRAEVAALEGRAVAA